MFINSDSLIFKNIKSNWLNKFTASGLREEHFNHFDVHWNAESEPTLYDDLATSLFKKKLSPEVVMNEMSGLSSLQASLLETYYKDGLRGDDLRRLEAAGKFTNEYRMTFFSMIKKHINPHLAAMALENVDYNVPAGSGLKQMAYEQYFKILSTLPNKAEIETERTNKLLADLKSKWSARFRFLERNDDLSPEIKLKETEKMQEKALAQYQRIVK